MSSLSEATKILQKGGIVIYPTDTAFGIGCRMDNSASVERLFKIRKRPRSQATPLLVSSAKMAQKYFLSPLPDNVRRLMDKYWPGALTIIYNANVSLTPPLVRGGGNTIGLRMPKSKESLTLIDGVGVPLLGPSANFHGGPTPFRYEDIDRNLISLVDFVVPGHGSVGNVSTVVDCTVVPFKIIRQGAVDLAEENV